MGYYLPSHIEGWRVLTLRSLGADGILLAADWLAQRENYQWLDFGHGQQVVTAQTLAFMLRRDIHLLRLYTADETDEPIGLVALSDISAAFKSATLWYVLGDKRYGGLGYTTRAVAEMLTLGFRELRVRTVHAWAVERNAPSIAVLRRNNFRLVGRLRQCHEIDGRPCDRLLFDLLAREHTEVVGRAAEPWQQIFDRRLLGDRRRFADAVDVEQRRGVDRRASSERAL